MRNLQTMQHEIERASGETRSRLEEQVTRLESQLYVFVSASRVIQLTKRQG